MATPAVPSGGAFRHPVLTAWVRLIGWDFVRAAPYRLRRTRGEASSATGLSAIALQTKLLLW